MADRKKVKKIIIDANYLAQLSNLKLSANEKSRLEQDLNNTLDFVKNIQQFEFNQTNTVDSLVQNKMFADGEENPLKFDKKKLFSNARIFRSNYFEVDKIL